MKLSRTTKVVTVIAVGLVALAGAVIAVNVSEAPEIVVLMVNGAALIIGFFAIEMAFIYGIAAVTGRSKKRGKRRRQERD